MIFGIVVKHHFLNAKRIRRGVRREMRRGREGVCEGRCGDGATGIEKMGAKRVRRGMPRRLRRRLGDERPPSHPLRIPLLTFFSFLEVRSKPNVEKPKIMLLWLGAI